MKSIFQTKGDGDVILGKIKNSFFRKEILTQREMNHHVHIVGASGFGKSVLLSHIIRQKIEQGQGLFYLDLKGEQETISNFLKIAKDSGREGEVQIFSLAHLESSNCYNFLARGSATELRDRIMMSFIWSEEYYKNVSSSFLLKLFKLLVEVTDSGSQPLNLEILLKCIKDREFLAEIVNHNISSKHRDLAQEIYNFLGDRQLQQSLEGLKSQLESLVLSDFGDLLNDNGKTEIDLFKSVQEKKLVFMFLDTRRFGESAKAIGKLLLQDLKAVSARIDAEVPRDQRNHFPVIIDEFSDLAQEDFLAFLDRARSSKMSVVVAHQELSDLDRISPQFAGRLMGNTSTLYAFLQKRPESAELISGMAGTRTVMKETRATESLFGFQVDTGKRSMREVEEFLVHPNVVKSLGVGECVVVKKYPYARAYRMKVSESLA